MLAIGDSYVRNCRFFKEVLHQTRIHTGSFIPKYLFRQDLNLDPHIINIQVTRAVLFSFRHFLFMGHLVKLFYAGLPPSMVGQWPIPNKCGSSKSISMRHCLETPLLVQREKHAHQRPNILYQCNGDRFFSKLLMCLPWPFRNPPHVIKRKFS